MTTSPSKPSSPRSSSVEHAAAQRRRRVVEGRHDDVRGHDRLARRRRSLRGTAAAPPRGRPRRAGSSRCESWAVSPWPGKCFAQAATWQRWSPATNAAHVPRDERRDRRRTSGRRSRGSSGFEFTSAHGARSRFTPARAQSEPIAGADLGRDAPRRRRRRARGFPGTSCRSPTSSRVTSPPSSSAETSTAGFSARSAAVSSATCSTSRTFQANRQTPPSPSASRRRTHVRRLVPGKAGPDAGRARAGGARAQPLTAPAVSPKRDLPLDEQEEDHHRDRGQRRGGHQRPPVGVPRGAR